MNDSNELHLFLYRGSAPGWPGNGRPRRHFKAAHFEAEVVLLPNGHGLRLTSENRTLAEYVLPNPPAPQPTTDVELAGTPRGSYFSNDRLLYRGEHRREAFTDDTAFQAAVDAAIAAAGADGAEVLRDPAGSAGSPVLGVLARDHEVEVRAVYPDPVRRVLLQWTSILGMKLKLRR